MFNTLKKYRIYNKIQPEKKHSNLENYKAQTNLKCQTSILSRFKNIYKYLLTIEKKINKKSKVKFVIAPSKHILFFFA